jgi:hypothetical protein
MKYATHLSLGVALALGLAMSATVTPAQAAKKEKVPDGPKIEISKEFRAAVQPIEADIKAAKYDGMSARLDALAQQYSMPDEKFFIGTRRYDFARATKNQAEIRKGVLEMLASNSTLATPNLGQLNYAAGQFAYNAKEHPEAISRLSEAVRLGNKEPDTFILLAESNFQLNKFAEGLAFAEQAVGAKTALGQKAPSDWYRRALSVAYKAKSQPQIAKWSRDQVGAYPTPENWRTALFLFKDANRLEGQQSLDIMRLMRSAKALAGEKDFFEYAALASERGLPGEAKSVIEEGMNAGTIGKTSRPINELLAGAAAKVNGDLASLGASEKQAAGAANGKIAAGTADAYLGYGQDSKAVPLYKLALQKGQVDADAVNTRLGIALARLGQKAEAREAFTKVGGARADIAKFWLTWLDTTT